MCPTIAMRKDPDLEVLFCCNRDDFLSIACLWSESLLRYKQIFEVNSLESMYILYLSLRFMFAIILPIESFPVFYGIDAFSLHVLF